MTNGTLIFCCSCAATLCAHDLDAPSAAGVAAVEEALPTHCGLAQTGDMIWLEVLQMHSVVAVIYSCMLQSLCVVQVWSCVLQGQTYLV